ncbi:hypothetical protein PHLGIDRAFT_362799 [Phlebiopsis gigantea 11061_1 CR5-6]|uniref:Uncharacterized protein n=1 Tax=Phlebiopsis gigantea (strain 11061_1 CR5-6) TaxID=745531 RepID=A0A0C3S110_PHLG1|nr:hypothetical protein PHLGIDRAFT_362799 [Phlebiopsis gigantea 11061_1 CR5-6]
MSRIRSAAFPRRRRSGSAGSSDGPAAARPGRSFLAGSLCARHCPRDRTRGGSARGPRDAPARRLALEARPTRHTRPLILARHRPPVASPLDLSFPSCGPRNAT